MSVVSVSDPLTLPTWLTAIFTGVLAVGAIVTAVFAIRAFGKQSQEVSDQATMLKVQSDLLTAQREQLRLLLETAEHEQQDFRREADERRRSRAALVYVTTSFDPGLHIAPGSDVTAIPREAGVDLKVHNTGSQPVYDVRVHWVDASKGSSAGEADVLGTLPPGEDVAARRDVPSGTARGDFVPVVYFRDAAGPCWTLLADGQLSEVDPTAPPGAPAIAIAAVMRSRGEI